MVNVINIQSDTNKILDKYMQDTTEHIKGFEKLPHKEQARLFQAVLYQLRLEHYSMMREFQNTLLLHLKN